MTATNKVVEGLDDFRESVALSSVYEALVWRLATENSMDPNYKGSGQRGVVYPKFLDKPCTVLATGSADFDTGETVTLLMRSFHMKERPGRITFAISHCQKIVYT
jgi:hypothetical protein